MKVIITGVTGYIGAEVLSACVKNPRITSIIALSRKRLPQYEGEPKVQVQIVPDFAKFETDVVESWKGAEACLW
jgi:nucleoside-diphosphate-sugar epimerase